MSSQQSSRFDALFGAARSTPSATDSNKLIETSKSSDAQMSKSSDPNFQRTTIYLPKEIHRKFKAYANLEGREMSEIAVELIQEWLSSRRLDA